MVGEHFAGCVTHSPATQRIGPAIPTLHVRKLWGGGGKPRRTRTLEGSLSARC